MKKIVFLLLLSLTFTAQSQAGGIIVKINYNYLDFSIINDRSILSGMPELFLNQDGIDYLEHSQIDCLNSVELRKIFPNLTTNDTLTIGRTGNLVPIPPFWSVFAFDIEGDLGRICAQLENMRPLVVYAHPNFEAQPLSIPNDENFGHQHSLYSTDYPDGHINMEPAWDIAIGKPFVKVGVYDSGIDSTNPDLNVLTGAGYAKKSFYIDGEINSWYWWGTDQRGHGTDVAGIIGARRNNLIGVAGIAGGDGSDTTGASLIDMKMLPHGYSYVEGCAAAIVDGARAPYTYHDWGQDPIWFEDSIDDYDNTVGFGLHIANHSYTFYTILLSPDQPVDSTDYNPSTDENDEDGDGNPDPNHIIERTEDCDLCIEALMFSNEANVANVVARGNHFQHFDDFYVYGPEYMFPQKVNDNMIISVGGSYVNGERWTKFNNAEIEGTWSSMMGDGIDLIAPATTDLVLTTRSNQDLSWTLDEDYDSTLFVEPFAGTSAAAPHVSGALALLLSYYNKPCYSNYNLANEDMEYLLQITSTDVHSVGYDDSSGWGRLNVENLLKAVEKPFYQVIHPEGLPIDTPLVVLEDTIMVYGNALVSFGPYWHHEFADPFIFGGIDYTFWVERYKMTATYDFSEYMVDPATELLAVWPRKNTSPFSIFMEDSVWVDDADFPPVIDLVDGVPTTFFAKKFAIEKDMKIESVVGNQVTMSGYFYHFIYHRNFEMPIDVWYPISPDTPSFDYSIYLRNMESGLGGSPLGFDFPCDSIPALYDTTATIYEDVIANISIFPNPYQNTFTILSDQPMKMVIIYDLNGKAVLKKRINLQKEHRFELGNLADGVYFANITLKNGAIINRKIIKQ